METKTPLGYHTALSNYRNHWTMGRKADNKTSDGNISYRPSTSIKRHQQLSEHPNNLVYDRSLKGYQPSPDFVAYYTTGDVNEYLNFLRNQHDLSRQLDIANSGSPNIEVLSVPKRNVNPDVVRVILHAIRESRRVELVYHSMNSPEVKIV